MIILNLSEAVFSWR